MKEVMEDLERIKDYPIAPQAWNKIEDRRKAILNEAFARCSNLAVICLELLSYYLQAWERAPKEFKEQETKDAQRENDERIRTATKSMFMLCVSAIEYSIKHALRMNPGPLPKPGRIMKLSKIILESQKQKLIDDIVTNQWLGLIDIRNALVHNNGIWEGTDKDVNFSNGVIVKFRENKMIEGNLRIFTQLTDWMLKAYIEWGKALLQ